MLELNLLENGLDSLGEAIRYFIRGRDEKNSRLYKFSILLMSHCVELMLKHILQQEHHSLIFKDIDEFCKKADTESITVDTNTALLRIRKICKIDVPMFWSENISDLLKQRNLIQHYKLSINEEVVAKLFSESYVIIRYLMNDILKQDIKNYIKQDEIESLESMDDLYRSKREAAIRMIKEKKLNRVKFEIYKDEFIKIPCPICNEKTLVQDGEIKCYFCFAKFDSLEVCFGSDENSYIDKEFSRQLSFRKNHDFKIASCPACNMDKLLFLEHNDKWFCIYCFSDYGSTCCENCGESIPDDEQYTYIGMYFGSDYDALEYETICENCTNDSKYVEFYG